MKDENQTVMGGEWTKRIIVRDKVKCKGSEMGQKWTWRNGGKTGVMNVGSKGERRLSPLYLLSLVPHEFLHGLCFRGDVYMYQNLKHGMLFVVGPERMSKGRFIFMSLLPNIVFGFIPFALFLIDPKLRILGTFGLISIASGAGDYINVYNALTQMPRGAWTYLYGFHSYWYLPEE